jgi:glycosyltransferase involved in cell wall biosynthesis
VNAVETLKKRDPVDIWFVSNLPPPVHGVAVFNASLVEEMARRGFGARVVRVGASSGESIGRFSIGKACRETVAIGRLIASALRARFRKGKKTVLYFTPSQGGPAALRDVAVALTGKLLFDCVVGHLHGCGWIERSRRRDPIAGAMRFTIQMCDRVICLGESFAQAMEETSGRDCVPIDNGAGEIGGAEQKFLPHGDEPLKLLFLGNFIRSKGLWVAADAAQLLHDSGTSVQLRCAGSWRSDADRSEFTRRFREAMSEGVIQLVGQVHGSAKEALLLDSHFLVMPTRYPPEGQPLAVIEAMSAGAVPIVTNQGGIPDLLRIPGSHLLVSATHETAQGIAETIQIFLERRSEYERYSGRCLDFYRDHLTFDRCATEVLAVLRGDPHSGMELWRSKRAAV